MARGEMMSTHVCRVDAGADDLASLGLQRLRLFTECLPKGKRASTPARCDEATVRKSSLRTIW